MVADGLMEFRRKMREDLLFRQRFWRDFYCQCARGFEADFFNYGYLASDLLVELSAEDELNRRFIQLYHYAASVVGVSSKDVLEVGCGNGGGAKYVFAYMSPNSYRAIDCSRESINRCKRRHVGPKFVVGDAHAIPFPDDSFDVVLNIESSHCYIDMQQFLCEVCAVLRPGGVFSWVDVRRVEWLEETTRAFRESELEIVSEVDLTAEVLMSVEEGHKEMVRRIAGSNVNREVTGRMCALKGTEQYNDFVSGGVVYLAKVLKKPCG